MTYRRIQGPTESRLQRFRLLPIALVALGIVLLVASGLQLTELVALESTAAARGTLGAPLPPATVSSSTILGAVLLPLAAVASFVAFGFARIRQTY